MLFTGYTELTVDAKGRLAIPAKYRNKWDPQRDGGAWYCVAWPDGSLRLYTETAFEALAMSREETLIPDRDEARLQVTFFSQAERLEMDSAGRIMLPKRHLQKTGLPQEVVMLGAGRRLEIRPREAWEEQEMEHFQNLQDNAERIEQRRREPGGG